MKNRAFATIISLTILGSCTKEEITPRGYPRVNTLEVTDVTSGGALFSAEIFFSSVPILDHGFLWSEYGNLLLNSSDYISLGSKGAVGVFEAKCDRSLQAGKTYYVRGYATSKEHTVYGDIVKFVSRGSKAPVMKDFYPSLATWENTVTIVGENFSTFGSNNVVKFNEVQASIIKASQDTLQVSVPTALTEELSSISISLIGNVAILQKKFQLRPPILDSITPSSVTAGSQVLIAGQYVRSPKTKVYFNDIEGVIVTWDSKGIECIVPIGIPAGNVTVKLVTGSGNLFDTILLEII